MPDPSEMFALRTPCKDCPWRSDIPPFITAESAAAKITAAAFQCHKTVDYENDEPAPSAKPRQCAGLMILLHKSGRPNQIMQVGERLGAFDPAALDLNAPIYASIEDAIRAFGGDPYKLLPSWIVEPPETDQKISPFHPTPEK